MQDNLENKAIDKQEVAVEEPYLWGHIVELSVRTLFCFSYFWLLSSIIIYNLLEHIRMRYQRDINVQDFCASQQNILVNMINKVEIKGFIVTLIIYAVYGILYAYVIRNLSTNDFLYRLLKIK